MPRFNLTLRVVILPLNYGKKNNRKNTAKVWLFKRNYKKDVSR